MKRFLPLLLVIAMALTQACEGPEGEQGPAGPPGTPGTPGAQGPQGPPGVSDSAQVFEIDSVTFNAANEYSVGLDFVRGGLELSQTDIILAYLLYGVGNDSSGNPTIPFWSPLPQTFYVDGKPITYSYLYSNLGMFLTLDAQFDLAEANKDYTGYTDNNVFRIVIIPGKQLGGRTTGKPLTKAELSKYPVDLNDYNAVVKYFNIDDSKIKNIALKK